MLLSDPSVLHWFHESLTGAVYWTYTETKRSREEETLNSLILSHDEMEVQILLMQRWSTYALRTPVP